MRYQLTNRNSPELLVAKALGSIMILFLYALSAETWFCSSFPLPLACIDAFDFFICDIYLTVLCVFVLSFSEKCNPIRHKSRVARWSNIVWI